MAPHHLRRDECHREVLQDTQGENQTVLQQPSVRQAGQPRNVPQPIHDVVQPSQEASGTGKDPGGDVIVTVSLSGDRTRRKREIKGAGRLRQAYHRRGFQTCYVAV